jgi:hypothetical protein
MLETFAYDALACLHLWYNIPKRLFFKSLTTNNGAGTVTPSQEQSTLKWVLRHCRETLAILSLYIHACLHFLRSSQQVIYSTFSPCLRPTIFWSLLLVDRRYCGSKSNGTAFIHSLYTFWAQRSFEFDLTCTDCRHVRFSRSRRLTRWWPPKPPTT